MILRGENAVNFFCTPKWRVRGYIAPPKMKVKGYMYPQMKKPVGMLLNNKTRPGSVLVYLYNQNNKAITFKLYNQVYSVKYIICLCYG